jgi:hypothetical protein
MKAKSSKNADFIEDFMRFNQRLTIQKVKNELLTYFKSCSMKEKSGGMWRKVGEFFINFVLKSLI